MDLYGVFNILVGSTFGIIIRLFIKNNFKKKIFFYLDYSLIVNVLSALFLGIFVALNPSNNNFFLFFFVGFLGCLSTFSSFIYQLFNLIQQKKYLSLMVYYIEVLALSFSFFCLGSFISLIFKN